MTRIAILAATERRTKGKNATDGHKRQVIFMLVAFEERRHAGSLPLAARDTQLRPGYGAPGFGRQLDRAAGAFFPVCLGRCMRTQRRKRAVVLFAGARRQKKKEGSLVSADGEYELCVSCAALRRMSSARGRPKRAARGKFTDSDWSAPRRRSDAGAGVKGPWPCRIRLSADWLSI